MRHFMRGQALVALLFFIVIAITVISAAVMLIVTNAIAVQSIEQGAMAAILARNGIDYAYMQLLRNPDYAGGTQVFPEGTAEISVSGTNTKTIYSTGKAGNYVRRIRAIVSYNNNAQLIISEVVEL